MTIELLHRSSVLAVVRLFLAAGMAMGMSVIAHSKNAVDSTGVSNSVHGAEDGIQWQWQGKRNILSWGLHVPAAEGRTERNEGLYYYTNDGYYGAAREISAKAQLDPQYLADQVNQNSWENDLPYSFSNFWITPNVGSSSYSGEIRIQRRRMVSSQRAVTAISRNYLKILTRTTLPTGPIETVTVELVQFTIPADAFASNWVELIPPVVAGWKYNFDLLPVEITVAFGLGPEPSGEKTSQELLEAYLDTIKVVRSGDTWIVKHTDAQGIQKFHGIEIVTTKEKLIDAIKRTGQNVVFDGHSNFGLGPNFSGKVTHKAIADFTHFGVGKTSIPKSFRGAGTEADVVPFTNGDGTTLPTNPQDLAAIDRVYSEGWAYLKLEAGQIIVAPQNYQVTELGIERFKNLQGVAPGNSFTKQGIGLYNEWHFDNPESSRRLIVQAPSTDVPTLGYAKFFYNACNTGRDYIESFKHGDFIYTKDSCKVEEATKIFVQGIIEGKSNTQIMTDLNQNGVGNVGNQSPQIYGLKTF